MDIGDTVGIGGGTIPDNLAEDGRTAPLGSFEIFEHDHGRTFADHKTIAQSIEGPRGSRRFVIACRQGGQQAEPRHAERMDHAVRAAREHHIGIATTNDLSRFAHRLAARRTSGQAVEVRAPRIKHAGHVPGRHIRFLLQFDGRIERLEATFDEAIEIELIVFQRGGHHFGKGEEVLAPLAAAQIDAEPLGIEARYPTRPTNRRPAVPRRRRNRCGVRGSSRARDPRQRPTRPNP